MDKKQWDYFVWAWVSLPILAVFLYAVGFSGKVYEFVVTGIVTFLAAWAGGWAAFNAERTTRERKEEEEFKRHVIVNGNSAIFTLMRMANKLANIQRQIIDPERDSPVRYISMRPLRVQEKDDVRLNIEGLYFLLETDDRNLLGEISAAEEYYKGAIDALNGRSQLHLDDVQPLLESGGFESGGSYSHEELAAMLGVRIYESIQLATNEAVDHIDMALLRIKGVSGELSVSLKKQYPSEKIINFTV